VGAHDLRQCEASGKAAVHVDVADGIVDIGISAERFGVRAMGRDRDAEVAAQPLHGRQRRNRLFDVGHFRG
jgi:hypothetical protein